ncbi:DUF4328 domain-containing protein [Streptomyces sp. VRA16 Mangrove soil]|uniref:DUF4328 domain-containing protein n=1 Tax=Streptomyces sp. VRA16 Mangrove soil TaxID=2817434 RepID=UPI001A9D49F0|nr:DUF4328 domain-containing protein [Streptomyces sp. VRA16 Mangrove soil]MBO1334850.1 DUF4328 domain-containing protein [Streptomyces sp. VRA16 Mangrove soil]
MLCKRCGARNALVEGGLCAPCADSAFATLTGGPQRGKDRGGDGAQPLPPPLPSAPYDPYAPWVRLKSPNGLAWMVVALLAVTVALDLAAVAVGIAEYRILGDLTDGAFSGYGDLARWDDLYTLAGRGQLVLLVLTAIAFIVWFVRVRDNAQVMNPLGQSKARGWAIGGFFVPIVSFWFPRVIAHDTWRTSADELELAGKNRSGLIDLWWWLWVADQLVGRFAGSQYSSAEDFEDMGSATGTMVFSDALDLAAAVAAICFVRSLTRLQNQKVLATTPMGGERG